MAERIRPFLKWPGGKYRLIDKLLEVLPPANRLIEPFAGGASVFLNTNYPRYLICDANADLIAVYQALKNNPKTFIRDCDRWFRAENNHADRYYELRASFNHTQDVYLKACLFVYINRHGYNGLCRYNSRGELNVPFGRYRSPYFPKAEMEAFAKKAKRAKFVCQDYRDTLKKCRSGNVVYCDPPYVPLSSTASFTKYSTGDFGETEQRDLAEHARRLAARGVTVALSNHDVSFTQEVYRGAEIHQFSVPRFISCDAANRASAPELIAVFSQEV